MPVERDADRVESALAALREEAFCISEWTRVEFTSAVGIKFRNRELSEPLARRALAHYYEAFEAGVTVITPSRDDYILAAFISRICEADFVVAMRCISPLR